MVKEPSLKEYRFFLCIWPSVAVSETHCASNGEIFPFNTTSTIEKLVHLNKDFPAEPQIVRFFLFRWAEINAKRALAKRNRRSSRKWLLPITHASPFKFASARLNKERQFRPFCRLYQEVQRLVSLFFSFVSVPNQDGNGQFKRPILPE